MGNKIPNLEDQLDNPLQFETPEFKLLASILADKSAHTVQINYLTGGLTLLNTINDYLILAIGDQTKNTCSVDTFMLKLQPNLSISQYQEA